MDAIKYLIDLYELEDPVGENHLRAFVRVLRLYDVQYQPEILDQTSFDRIMEH